MKVGFVTAYFYIDGFCVAVSVSLLLMRRASVIPFTEEEYSDGDIPVAALNCLEK